MLPAAARLRRRQEFTDVVRRGRRTSRGPLTFHLVTDDGPTQVGFVIGKVVGQAVVRNRLRRRLRQLLRAHLATLPPGTRLVVRAREGAGDLPSNELARLVDAGLGKLVRA
ncbi:MAG TPA: ribonuclease P protein component [Frankiaceae bacterium]|nr:ribonuclease P protein component [Frankiaceae bacterium]